MTKDNFDYYTDKEFEWTGILEYYHSPNFIHKKGTIFNMEVKIDKPLDEIDCNMIFSLASSWTWGEDRRIKAFKLKEYQIAGTRIFLEFHTIRKSQRYDEIKYFLFSLGSFLDLCEYRIEAIKVNEVLRKDSC